jgi:hypothetical protein
MGKASNRKRSPEAAPSDGVHERIQVEARQAREAPELRFRDYDESTALHGLLSAARKTAGNATPAKFIYEGRPYWLRISIGMALVEVFDSPATAQPLVKSITGSTDFFGHTPGH